jgi:hypothetical protein
MKYSLFQISSVRSATCIATVSEIWPQSIAQNPKGAQHGLANELCTELDIVYHESLQSLNYHVD